MRDRCVLQVKTFRARPGSIATAGENDDWSFSHKIECNAMFEPVDGIIPIEQFRVSLLIARDPAEDDDGIGFGTLFHGELWGAIFQKSEQLVTDNGNGTEC